MSRNKSLLLPVILSAIGVVLWTVASFLGFVYCQNIFLACVFPLLILVLLGLSLFLLVGVSQNPEIERGRRKTIRAIAWSMYIIGSLVSLYYLNHFIKVSLKKGEIQTEALAEVAELKNTYLGTSRDSGSFAEYLDTEKSRLKRLLESDAQTAPDARVKVAAMETNVTCTALENGPSFNDALSQTEDFLAEVEPVISAWNPFRIGDSLAELLSTKMALEDYASRYHTLDPYTMREPFVPKSEHNSDLSGELRNTDFGTNWQTIVVAILLQLLMLLPVFLTIQVGGKGKAAKMGTL